jgi:hypothetical protein
MCTMRLRVRISYGERAGVFASSEMVPREVPAPGRTLYSPESTIIHERNICVKSTLPIAASH